MVGKLIQFRGSKFEVTSLKENDQIGAKQINPNNGKIRKNSKEVIFKIEQVEVL